MDYITVWGQVCKTYLDKIFILQKRVLRFMYFAEKNEHTVPLRINANLLPLNFLYFKMLSELIYDVRNASAPPNICNRFTSTSSIHSYDTRSSASNNSYIKRSRLEIQQESIKKKSFQNGKGRRKDKIL